jgi:serine protease AprX
MLCSLVGIIFYYAEEKEWRMGNSLSGPSGLPWRRTMRAFMAATMALGVLGVMPGSTALQSRQAEAAVKAHPMLLQMAQQRPDQTVSVIVQKWGADSSAEQNVQSMGGQVTKDLSIINAFAADVPAGSVSELAASDGVRWVSLDAPVEQAGKPAPGGTPTPTPTPTACTDCVDTKPLKNTHIVSTKVDQVWNTAPYLQGQGMTVAVVDSGISENHPDFKTQDGKGTRIVGQRKFSENLSMSDGYGHGTHVAGIIAGNARVSGDEGKYPGVAPKANLLNVKVSDDDGRSTSSDVIAGLQWVLDTKATYNTRVVNLSLNSSVYESYHTNPICAAVEILWFNGIVVVVSAGNNGSATLFPPANDPFVITVGAVDDRLSTSITDDVVTSYSAYGTTPEGHAKPDLVAPGYKIKAPLSYSSDLEKLYPSAVVTSTSTNTAQYFRMSGTSMSAPIVAGAAALLLQDEPNLTPDQVKYRLKATAVKSTKTWPGYNSAKAGAGYLDVKAAVLGTTTASANTNIQASQLLWSGSEPLNWSSVNWNSVNWNSVNWNSVNWNSVNWNSVNWNSTYWEP